MGARLLSHLITFNNMVLRGEVPDFIIAIFYGVTIRALMKNDGGVHPVAVGNILRRLATKVGIKPLSRGLGQELRSVQLGFSTKEEREVAAAHANRANFGGCDNTSPS